MSDTTRPELIIDTGLDDNTAESVRAIDSYIHENPGRASKIIALYAENSNMGDRWSKLLADEDETRAPFRLTAALGSTANRDTIRYVSFDEATEDKIAGDLTIKDLLTKLRITRAVEEKEAASKKIGLLRLSIYADVLATYATTAATEEPDEDTNTAQTA